MDGMSFISRSLSLVCLVFCSFFGCIIFLFSGASLVLVMLVTYFFLFRPAPPNGDMLPFGGLLGTVKAWSCPTCVWADQR